jgi:hypothetical protein
VTFPAYGIYSLRRSRREFLNMNWDYVRVKNKQKENKNKQTKRKQTNKNK